MTGQPRAVPDERPASTGWRGPRWPAVVGFWTALGLLECLTAPLRASLARRPIGLTEALINNLPWWLLWAPLTAIPVALSRRFPLQGPRWRRSVLAHLAGALLTTTIHLPLAITILIGAVALIDVASVLLSLFTGRPCQ